MPLVQTRGAASAQGFGEFAQAATAVNYIEDVFSCFLYTGTGSSQTITNNIDLSTKGGLTWIKGRSGATGHRLTDTARGATKSLESNSTAAEVTESTGLTAFGTTGFTIGADADYNTNAATYVSWTFRKQPKFFDVVTYTGDGVGDRTISHNLGAVPAVIIIKQTNDTRDWVVRTTVIDGSQDFLFLNKTDAKGDSGISNTWSTTSFTVSSGNFDNGSGNTYVAYLFASNAGGFGLTGSDNVISCGSYTTDGSGNATISLGYEPQWVMIKRTDSTGDWRIMDNMRGLTNDYAAGTMTLLANTSGSESGPASYQSITATGFQNNAYAASATFIYIAIRRGPMKVPTSGTSVFAPSTAVEPQSSALFTAGFSDMTLHKPRLPDGNAPWITDRLRGNGVVLETPYTSAEATYSTYFKYDSNVGAYIPASGYYNNSGGGSYKYALYAFKRAPSFFDEVCYTGNDTLRTINHNLGVAPEMMIIKSRSNSSNWFVYLSSQGNNKAILLNSTGALFNASYWNNTAPTASVFTLAGFEVPNQNGYTFVNYLFSTCAGVSKVGSYTGTATTKQIDCGFTGGARFVLIKRTDDTGDWYVWDTARGIVSGNDPYLLLNSTAAEVTNTDYIDTYSAGFELSSTAPSAINASGGTFIFLAIA